MSNSTSFARLGYLALKKETTAGTAVYPNTFLELIDESIEVSYGLQSVEPIAGKRDARLRTVKDVVTITGTINVMVDAKTVGYLLQGALGAPTTTTLTASTSYQHVFTPANTLVTFTMDIKKAGFSYVERYVGVRIEKLTLSQSDNKIMAAIDIQAQKVFTSASILTAASSGTALNLDQTSGLVAGSDTISVLDKGDENTNIADLTVTTITDEKNLVVSTIGVQLDVLDIVVIKSQTPTYSLGQNMTWIGGSTYYIGDTADHPVDNTAAVNVEDFNIEIENTLEVKHAASGVNVANRFPTSILLKDFRARGSLTKFYEAITFIDDLRNSNEVGTRIRMEGALMSANAAVAAALDIGTGANGTVTITADTAGRAGEDFNCTIAVNDTDDLAASLTGNNILLELASTTASKNTATLVAVAIAALSGVTAAASGDGTSSLAIAAVAKRNLGDTTAGRDASENESLQVSFPNCQYSVFGANLKAEDLINQEIPFEANYDEDGDLETVRVVLRNTVSAY